MDYTATLAYTEAVRSINECVLQKTPFLSLKMFRLQFIPNEIQQCTHLLELDLSQNEITDIKALSYFDNLSSLDLSGTHIKDVSPLAALDNLISLNLGNTPISDASPLANFTRLTSLDLSYTEISDISALAALTVLTSLNLNNTPISDASPLAALTGLTSLDLLGTPITDATPLAALINLTRLDLGYTQISDAVPLAGLIKLTSLDLCDTPISDASPLADLTSLASLDLCNTRISNALPFSSLTSLISLNLSDTQINDAAPLASLTRLDSLDLSYTKVSDAAPLADLTSLISLNLNDTQISDATPLAALTKLRALYLSDTKITDATPLAAFTSLERLSLSSTQISNAVPLAGLTNLTMLDLGDTLISDASPLAALDKLYSLNLGNTPISDVSSLADLTNLHRLSLSETQISNTNSLLPLMDYLDQLSLKNSLIRHVPYALLALDNCVDELRAWLAETAVANDCASNTTVKLMLTGNGNAGKSSLLNALQSGACGQEKYSTHGIAVNAFAINQTNIHAWDFGGQEIYHSTHRLFMESEAVQLILVDPEKEAVADNGGSTPDRISGEPVNEYTLAYWLETVQRLSPRSRIIVVQNKADRHKTTYPGVLALAEQYGAKFCQVSATTGQGIRQLRALVEEEAEQLWEYGMPMPKSWLQVRDWFIHNLQQPGAERTRLLTMRQFEGMCAEYNVMKQSVPALLTLLHHNGCLYYSNKYLPDTIIADQEWALAAVYKPFDRTSKFYIDLRVKRYGMVLLSELYAAFGQDYTLQEKQLFVQFMQSCALCFALNTDEYNKLPPEQAYYIFPEFLTYERPASVPHFWRDDAPDSFVQYTKQYPFLDRQRIYAIICALAAKTKMEYIWRNGIIVQHNGHYFMVAAQGNAITITMHSPIEKELLPLVMEAITDNETPAQQKCEWQQLTPKGKVTTHPQAVRRDNNAGSDDKTIQAVLKDVVKPQPKKLVVSYASENRAFVEMLAKKVKGLCTDGKLYFQWDDVKDRRLLWNDALHQMFEGADGFILFFSDDYFDDERKAYIHTKEIPIIERLKKEKGVYECCINVGNIAYVPERLSIFNRYQGETYIPASDFDRDMFFGTFVKTEIMGRFLKM